MIRWEKRLFVDGKININFIASNRNSASLILFIPGGPGLSSHYLDEFIFELSNRADTSLALLDLPNHDQSLTFSAEQINFSTCSKLICEAVHELSKVYSKIYLFGHSLGGAFLLNQLDMLDVERIFLCSVPVRFDHSSEFKRKKSEINVFNELEGEAWFQMNFYLLRSLYFNSLSFLNLNAKWRKISFWTNGKHLMQLCFDSPPYNGKSIPTPKASVDIIEGVEDIVLCEKNGDLLKDAIPYSTLHLIEKSGHFPFMENAEKIIAIILQKF